MKKRGTGEKSYLKRNKKHQVSLRFGRVARVMGQPSGSTGFGWSFGKTGPVQPPGRPVGPVRI